MKPYYRHTQGYGIYMACVWYVYGIYLPEATLERCKKCLRLALDSLADRSFAGEEVTISDVETAVCAYAVEHPDAICIASVTGYQEQYLTGEWPTVITLKALKGQDTLTIVVK